MLSPIRHVRLFVTPWTVTWQALLSMGFSRQECWSGLPCPPPGDLPNPGIELTSLMSPALAGGFFTSSATWEALSNCRTLYYTYLVTTIPLNSVPIILLNLSLVVYWPRLPAPNSGVGGGQVQSLVRELDSTCCNLEFRKCS